MQSVREHVKTLPLALTLRSLRLALRSLPFALFLCYAPLRPEETYRPMSSESKSRIIHENLDTSFVNLWSLLRSLSQRGFIGRVHVELADYTADVFMTGSNTPVVHEIDRAAGTDTLEEAALHRLVLRARESPGSISVFEGEDEAVSVKTTEAPESEIPAVASTEPPSTPPTETSPPGMNEPAESAPAAAALPDEPVKSAPPVTSPVEPAIEEDEAGETIEWRDVIKISGELIGGVERAMNSAGADFAALFRVARLELADDYTFLDPLSEQFDYSNSTVTLAEAPPGNSYVAGLSEALRRVVDKVATGETARRVRERVALELALLSRKRKEIVARSGFRAQLDRIAGTKVI